MDEAGLKEGELEDLEEEQRLLANAEAIKESLTGVENLIDTSSLKEARKQLEKAGKYVPDLIPLEQRLESARLELNDILEEVSIVNSRTELPGSRLE